MSPKNNHKHKLGALVGALCGDAAGAPLEFYRGKFTQNVVMKAMSMPGGGSLNVAPGQITDDGELTLALYSVLKDCKHDQPYPIDDVARAYKEWHLSEPFDMGMTCSKAFGSITLKEKDGLVISSYGQYMISKASEYNMTSQANGALMRATPIAVFYSKEGYTKVAECARLDAKLSHPNQICQDANVMYCEAISWLLNNSGDAEGALEFVEQLSVCPEVKKWFEDSKEEVGNCTKNIGHVKHAFTLAFHFLRRKETYETSIYETLLKGGDTDTNACIVGGMMGALHGYDGIPDYMKVPVLKFDCSKWDPKESLMGYKRPNVYRAKNVLQKF